VSASADLRAGAGPSHPLPGPDDVQPVANETLDRVITGFITAAPVVAIFFAGWQSWQGWLRWSDLIVLAILYTATGLGVTVGFHRLLTHRSFKTKRPVKVTFAILGSAAIEGPVISWVADHRKHHAFSDREGDPHSPHVGHGDGWRGALRGLVHAHVGWLFLHDQRGAHKRYAPDLLADPDLQWVNRTFFVWAVGGFVAAFALGAVIGGSLWAGLTGMLWGGLVRTLLLHHVTYSINSICHMFGRRRFETTDESRNVLWLALPSFGEAFHNNHHAFPTSASHGLGRSELLDPSAWVIRGLERVGLAWDVRRPKPEQMARRAVEAQSTA
jgi:stearoyl-CoA desaturase (Delta-9 desaturase)